MVSADPPQGDPPDPASAAPTGGDQLVINAACSIALSEIEWRFSTSGGPGGQHANRSHTRAEAIFAITGSPSLTDDQRRRLVQRFGAELTVSVDDTRSQTRNRAIALDRLREKIAGALVVSRPRRKTKPSKAATQRRLDAKRQRGETKRRRSGPSADD
jgi:ribosome-associated protein